MPFDLPLIMPPIRHIVSRYAKSSALILVTVVAVTLASALASVAAPYLFSVLIDGLAPGAIPSGLIFGFMVYAILMGLAFSLQRVVSFLTFMTSETLDFIASTAFFEKLVEKTADFYLDHNPAEIQSAQQQGTGALNVVVQFGLAGLVPGIAQVTLSLVTLGAALSLDIVVIVVLYGVAYVALVASATRQTRPHLDAAVEASQDGAKFVGNAIGGMETLRQFGSDRWMIGQFVTHQRKALDRWRRYALIQVRYSILFGLALTLQFAITLWLLVPRVEAGAMTVGGLVLFNTLLLQLNLPFQIMGQAIQQFAQSYSRFLPFARMWQAEGHPEAESHAPLALTDGTVTFDTVGYRYPNGRGVWGASFTARRGTITYITGDTGAGKTTLFKLLLKSMTPQAGTITVDGLDIAAIPRAAWFSRVATVPQDIVLLNDTLATNIVLGRRFDQARLRRAAAHAAILDFIQGLDEGFDTIVGERGLKLSGGERQRIAIARALYDDPAILLLDEASSALDADTEKDIMDRLHAVCDTVTIIAITHRLSVIGENDTVVHLDAG